MSAKSQAFFLAKENAKWLPQIVMYVLPNQIIQKKNILFMFYHIHGTFKFTEYSVYVSSHTCAIEIQTPLRKMRACPWILSKYLSVCPSVHPFVSLFARLSPWDHFGSINCWIIVNVWVDFRVHSLSNTQFRYNPVLFPWW